MYIDLANIYYALIMCTCVVREPLGPKGWEDNSDTFPNLKELIL